MASLTTQYPPTTTTTTTAYPYLNYPWSGTSIVTGTGVGIGTTISYPNTYTWIDTAYTVTPNPLKNLKYIVDFDHNIDDFGLLEDNIKGIRKNKFLFNCHYEGNRIQPYEIIMKLIRTQQKFSVKINVNENSSSSILTIHYINLQFIKIENNLNFNDDCDFSELKVKFKCEKILHENHKLSQKELRADKLKKIIENNE